MVIKICVLILLFWFLFLREEFTNTIPTNETCGRCNKMILNNSSMNLNTFKNKCNKLDGIYVNKSCINYKSKLDSNYKCNCEIK